MVKAAVETTRSRLKNWEDKNAGSRRYRFDILKRKNAQR